jgi:plasmid stabilization system protein ParE
MGGSKRILWSPLAEEDLNNILEYLEREWEQQVIFDFLVALENDLDRISKNPKVFPLINSLLNIRKYVITKHNTLYYAPL